MAGLLCPAIASTTDSGALASRQSETKVCRREWKPTSTTARLPVLTVSCLPLFPFTVTTPVPGLTVRMPQAVKWP